MITFLKNLIIFAKIYLRVNVNYYECDDNILNIVFGS
jgi:hypothetical protein